MTYENSFLFGKNASIINEAYSKMYSTPRRRRGSRMINEGSEGGPSDDELRKNDLGLSREQREYMKNFDPDKEYKEIMTAEKRGQSDDTEEEEKPVAVQSTSREDDDDEDTQNFMSSFNSRRDSDVGGGGDDFIFSHSRYEDMMRKRYPDWLMSAAKAAGHKLPSDDDEERALYGDRAVAAPARSRVSKPTEVDGGDVDDGGDPWDNLWENVIVANPDVFNEERYDMEELPKHKKEFMEKWQKHFLKVGNEIAAAERALEEIPGCECKIKSDDYIGNIDSEDTEDTVEEPEPFKSPWDVGGFSVVVKTYERDLSPGARYKKYATRYITPPQLQESIFDTKEAAISALRDYMTELIGDPSDVCIGVVIDNSISNKIHRGEGFADMKDADGNVVMYTRGPMAGKPKKVKLNSTVYTISSSDKDNTDTLLAYATSDYDKEAHVCDEYLQ